MCDPPSPIVRHLKIPSVNTLLDSLTLLMCSFCSSAMMKCIFRWSKLKLLVTKIHMRPGHFSWNVNLGEVPSKNYIVDVVVPLREIQRDMEASRCSRQGWKVMKINITLVWTGLCSLWGTFVFLLRVPSANASLPLSISSCFILTPQWNCDNLHYVRGLVSRTAVLSSAVAFNHPSLWFIVSCWSWNI